MNTEIIKSIVEALVTCYTRLEEEKGLCKDAEKDIFKPYKNQMNDKQIKAIKKTAKALAKHETKSMLDEAKELADMITIITGEE